VRLVDVVLDDRELLDSPLLDINQRFDLLARVCVEPVDCLLELRLKLRVIRLHKTQCVHQLCQPMPNLLFGNSGECGLLVREVSCEKTDEFQPSIELPESAVAHEQVKQLKHLHLHGLLAFDNLLV